MSPRTRFLLGFLALPLIGAFLVNSHATISPTQPRGSPIEASAIALLMMVALAAGLIVIVVIVLYFKDIPSKRRSFQETSMLKTLLSLFIVSSAMAFIFHNLGPTKLRALKNSTQINKTIIPNVGPFTTNGNSSMRFYSNQIANHLWLVFLIPMLIATVYAGYYYYGLIKEEKRKKEKLKIAMKFDEELDKLGLERFSNPREAVVEIYKNAVLWLEGLGIPYRESWTHWEHAQHVRYMHKIYIRLAELFEKAKYAPARVDWEDAQRAFELYNKLRREANEIVAHR